MKKHRGVFLAMGLAALMGLMVSEARAANMTIAVYKGNSTALVDQIDSFTGGTQTLFKLTDAQLNTLNSDLHAAGYSAYTFNGLQGTSNNQGSAVDGAFIQLNGQLTSATTGTGIGSPITVLLTENGFTLPTSMPSSRLVDGATANYAGTVAGAANSNTTNTGYFDSNSAPLLSTSTAAPALPSTGVQPDNPKGGSSTSLGPYGVPFTLTSVTGLTLTPAAGGNGASNSFSNTVSVLGAVPEPASIVMMLTGMPLPLVVVGLLRRRRAA